MGKGSVHLAYPVRLRVIGKYTGQLCVVLAAVTAVPLIVGIIAGQWGFAWRTALSVAVLGGGGMALNMLSAPGRLQTNEALIVSAAAFLIGALAMVFPLMSFGLTGLDALFEAVSGVTTTGLTTMASVEDKPRVFLFARAWMQWYGGLGVVALSLAFLTRPGIIARRLSMAEPEEEELVASTRAHSRRVIVVYGLLTAGGFVLLLLCGASWFPALAHTLSAVSTGGFSIYDDSLSGQGALIRGGVIFVSLTGAISFGLYYRAFRRDWRDLLRDLELKAVLAIAGVFSILLFLLLRFGGGQPLVPAVGDALFMGLTAQTTTGYTTVDVAGLDAAPKLVLIVSMFVGGDSGSTAGGIKIVRLLIFLEVLRITILRTALTEHAVAEPEFRGERIESGQVVNAACVVLMFVLVNAVAWVAFLIYGHDPLNSLFDVVSATGTVGLSTGVTSPELQPFLKGLLCVNMLMGRLEILAILALLYPRNWFGQRKE